MWEGRSKTRQEERFRTRQLVSPALKEKGADQSRPCMLPEELEELKVRPRKAQFLLQQTMDDEGADRFVRQSQRDDRPRLPGSDAGAVLVDLRDPAADDPADLRTFDRELAGGVGGKALAANKKESTSILGAKIERVGGRADQLTEDIPETLPDALERQAGMQLVPCDIKVRKMGELGLDLDRTIRERAANFLRLFGPRQELGSIPLQALDLFEQTRDPIVLEELGSKARIVFFDLEHPLLESRVLAQQSLSERGALMKTLEQELALRLEVGGAAESVGRDFWIGHGLDEWSGLPAKKSPAEPKMERR